MAVKKPTLFTVKPVTETTEQHLLGAALALLVNENPTNLELPELNLGKGEVVKKLPQRVVVSCLDGVVQISYTTENVPGQSFEVTHRNISLGEQSFQTFPPSNGLMHPLDERTARSINEDFLGQIPDQPLYPPN